jgi:hypothetical protein
LLLHGRSVLMLSPQHPGAWDITPTGSGAGLIIIITFGAQVRHLRGLCSIGVTTDDENH